MTTSHTPTPLEVRGRAPDYAMLYTKGREIGEIYRGGYYPHGDEYAAYIVRAVNAHDQLVAALQTSHKALHNQERADVAIAAIERALKAVRQGEG